MIHVGEQLGKILSISIENPQCTEHPPMYLWYPPILNLNHNAYSIYPRIYVKCESMARGTNVHLTLPELSSEWTLFVGSLVTL